MDMLKLLSEPDWPHLAERAVLGLVVVAIAFVAARVASSLFDRARARAKTAASSLYIFQKLVAYGLIILGILLGLSVSGINITSLAVFAGAIGVGVGLGLQGVVKGICCGYPTLRFRIGGVVFSRSRVTGLVRQDRVFRSV